MLPPVLLRSGHLPPLHLMQKGFFSLFSRRPGLRSAVSGLIRLQQDGAEPAWGAVAEKNPGKFSPAANTSRGYGNHPLILPEERFLMVLK